MLVLVLDQVPFVDRDDQSAALALDQIGQRQILLFERDSGIEHQHHDFGILDRAQAIAHGQLFQLAGDLGAAADTGGIDQVDHPAFPFPRHQNAVAGNAGLGADQHAVFADHAVDQRGFTGIGTADNGDVEVALGIPAQRGFIALAFQHVLGDIDIDLGHFLEIGNIGGLLGLGGVDGLGDDGIEFRQPQPVFSRKRNRFAKAEAEGFDQTRLGSAAFGLVADQVHDLAGLAQNLSKALIERHHAGARVDHEQDDVGFLDRQLGLLAHAVFEAPIGHVFVTGGVEHAEAEISDMAFGLTAVAGDAGRIIDKRNLAADEPVEQRGFADIGATDNGNGDGHGRFIRSERSAAGPIRGSAPPPRGQQGALRRRQGQLRREPGSLQQQAQVWVRQREQPPEPASHR